MHDGHHKSRNLFYKNHATEPRNWCFSDMVDILAVEFVGLQAKRTTYCLISYSRNASERFIMHDGHHRSRNRFYKNHATEPRKLVFFGYGRHLTVQFVGLQAKRTTYSLILYSRHASERFIMHDVHHKSRNRFYKNHATEPRNWCFSHMVDIWLQSLWDFRQSARPIV